MRTVSVSLRALRKAIEVAHTYSDDWQAEVCEILLIPAIHKRWCELNACRLPGLKLDRVAGIPNKGKTPDDNRAIGEANGWRAYAGYQLTLCTFAGGSSFWNLPRDDYYGHSPSTAWDGIRRETISQFVHDLRMIALGYDHPDFARHVSAAKIRVSGYTVESAVVAVA